MAKAHWEADTGHDVPWEDLHPDSQALDFKRMRAALLALAEVELPRAAVVTTGPLGMTTSPQDRRLIFSLILRSIAEDQP